MGKIIKAIAVIAIAAAIAYFAPELAPAFLVHAVGATVAASITAAVISVGVSVAFQAITAAPADAPSGIRKPTFQRDSSGLNIVELEPAAPAPITIDPIKPRSWRWAFFWPWQRYSIVRLVGDCMDGVVTPGDRWALISRYDPIRPGDLFCFDLDDLWRTYRPDTRRQWWRRIAGVGMVKRYLGLDPEWGRLIFDCTNPPTVCETGRNRVRFAYRVLSCHPSLRSAWRGRRAAIHNWPQRVGQRIAAYPSPS